MDRELRRKINELIGAATAVLNLQDEMITATYHFSIMSRLSETRDQLRSEMLQEKYDESAI